MSAVLEAGAGFWVLLVVLFAVAAILAAMWSATGRNEPLLAAGVAVGLIPMLWMIERMVVTDREAIAVTLHEIAADVKSNNRSAVLSHIHPSATALRARAEAEMPNYRFTECKVNKVHAIEVQRSGEEATGTADFNVYVSGTFQVGKETFQGDFVRRVELQMRRDAEGRWRVEDYSHSAPIPRPRQPGGEPGDNP